MSQVYYPQCRVTLSVVFEGFGAGQRLVNGLADPFTEDTAPMIVQVIPKASQVNLTGYKEADTWSLTFDAKALPFAPDIIRSVAVEIYMFDAKAVFPSEQELWALSSEENMLVTGLADNTEITYSGDGREFTLDGRDYTALMLDKHWDPRTRVSVGKPVSVVVQEIVDLSTGATKHGGRTLTVEYVSEKPEPVIGQYRSKTNKKGIPVKDAQASNAWDVIYKLCLTEGLIVFVRGWKVIITDPQTFTLQNANKVRKVAYGRNLSNLKVSRKLGKEKVPQIAVTSYSSKKRKPIKAVFPTEKDPAPTGIGTKKDEVLNFEVDGVDDEVSLRRYAEAMYNNLARGESKIEFSTKSLTDLSDEQSLDANSFDLVARGLDMLKLRAGDPVVIGFDPFNEQVMESSSPEQRYQYLISQGYSASVAEIVATEYERLDQFQRPFYVRDVGIAWAHKEGITIDVEAINFVSVARDDKTATADPAATSRKVAKSTDNSKVGQ